MVRRTRARGRGSVLEAARAITIAIALAAQLPAIVQAGKPAPPPPACAYRVTNLAASLPAPDAYAQSSADEINDSGWVVGTYLTAQGDHSVLWQVDTAGAVVGTVDLGQAGPGHTKGLAINGFGDVAGWYQTTGATYGYLLVHGSSYFVDDGQGYNALMTLLPGIDHFGCRADAVSDTGFAVGQCHQLSTGYMHAVLWYLDQDGLPVIRVLEGADASAAWDINSDGYVVGSILQRAILWKVDALGTILETIDLGTLGGTESGAFGINEDGVVFGWAKTAAGARRAVRIIPLDGPIWFTDENSDGANDLMQNLGVLDPRYDGNCQANHGNLAGEVVGNSTDTRRQESAFVWRNGSMLELDICLVNNKNPVWNIYKATGVREGGQIVGQGRVTWSRNEPPNAGDYEAYLLTKQ